MLVDVNMSAGDTLRGTKSLRLSSLIATVDCFGCGCRLEARGGGGAVATVGGLAVLVASGEHNGFEG